MEYFSSELKTELYGIKDKAERIKHNFLETETAFEEARAEFPDSENIYNVVLAKLMVQVEFLIKGIERANDEIQRIKSE